MLDRVMPTIIPDKGEVVNSISQWWFKRLREITPNHFLDQDVPESVRGRAMLVRRLRMFPFELTVVGYMTAACFAQYQATGKLAGQRLPKGLKVGDRLAEPLFLPAIKGDVGYDDEPISFSAMKKIAGKQEANKLRQISLELYLAANEIAQAKGLIIADVKLEFGTPSDPGDEEIVLGDQAFTPDTATYWIADEVAQGKPRSFGKDYVRDAVERNVPQWAGNVPGVLDTGEMPAISADVVEEMSCRYKYVRSELFKP
ncbi:Phosphoribosylaminoimidazole-succinocarboxamide synthase [Trueperella bialowiezensis]|uniref:phosphoribosylaminoimidazolesuccinocarboxamide synthase n=1 Tax=Trueperella bialowiezensis TaxID=312285 RepID=A0A3S4UZF5_9ACTO|nr:Phosphoribosylaminoimidazole-succinocarboxamide synthase [Trueperella bialowiezensis]